MKVPFNPNVKANKAERKKPKHLAFIRSLECMITGMPDPVPHHLLRGVNRGMGMKADDKYTVPLSHDMHMQLHNNGNEIAFFEGYQITNLKAIAERLYEYSKEGNRDMAIQYIRSLTE